MRRKITAGVLCTVCFMVCTSTFVCAETIILRNGEKIEGTITKDTPKYVKVKTVSGEIIYFKSAIKSIDQKESIVQVPATSEQAQQPSVAPQAEVPAESAQPIEPAQPIETVSSQQVSQDIPQSTDGVFPVPSVSSSMETPFKTLKILYEITENDQQSERAFSAIVYIDRAANKRRGDLTEIFQPGQIHAKRDEITIIDGVRCYFFDMAKGVASVEDLPQPFSAWVDTGNDTLHEEDAITQQTVAGKKCFVYKKDNLQIWVWRGITLKRVEKTGQIVKRFEAISIEEDVPLADDLFTIPDSIKANMTKQESIPEVREEALPVKKTEPVASAPLPAQAVEPAPVQETVERYVPEVKQRPSPKVIPQEPLSVVQPPSDSTVIISPEDFRALKQGGTGALEALAKIDLNNIETGLELYRVDTGSYPTTRQGLRALMSAPAKAKDWQGPYLSKEPRDPWGNAYTYSASEKNGFELYSKGPDGKAHTGDDIAK